MKNIKKIVGLMMCVVLAIGCLAGCGKKSDEEILMSAVSSINKAKSFDMKATMSGKMTMKMGEQSQDMDMAMEMTGTQFTDPVKAKVTATQTVAGTAVTTESYVQKEDDKYVIYTKSNNQWGKMTMGDLDQALAASGMNSTQQLGEDVTKYTKKEDKTEGEKAYMVYDYTLSAEEMKDMMGSVTSSMESLFAGGDGKEIEEILNAMFKDIGSITMTIWIDRDTETIYRIEYPMTDMMNKMFDSLFSTLADKADKDGGDEDTVDMAQALSQIKMEVSDMNMVASYSNIDKAADFTIPEEALSAEEISLDDATATE